jgi:hypothetical protein
MANFNDILTAESVKILRSLRDSSIIITQYIYN